MIFKIRDHPNYGIDEPGNVYSYPNKSRNGIRILSTRVDKDGYSLVSLQNGKKQKTFKIHRLIAQTFIPNPLNLPQVNHIDENKQNNSIKNLEWVTAQQNIIHSLPSRKPRADRLNVKLSEENVRYIRDVCKDKLISKKRLAAEFGVTESLIEKVYYRTIWKDI